MYKAILSFGHGTLRHGFAAINVQLYHQQQLAMRDICSLPAAPELEQLYQQWRAMYHAYYQNCGWSMRIELHDTASSLNRFSRREFDQICVQFSSELNHWLCSESFSPIERTLRTSLSPDDCIQIILETEDEALQLLPWQDWQFLTNYPKADIAFSLLRSRPPPQASRQDPKPVNVLGILGSPVIGEQRDVIDVSVDRAAIENVADVNATFLIEPSRADLIETLWNGRWDILFFAGHSTVVDGQTALIVNQEPNHNRLTVPEFRHALNHAVEQGLQLAIFNSCDSLGLAWALAELNIPQTIAFRNIVPDAVAHAFLKHFLAAFSVGVPTSLAVRCAREQLQAFEPHYPCASWLPIICQNPTVMPLTWADLRGPVSTTKRERQASVPRWQFLAAGLVATVGILSVRTLGLLQGLELRTFDQLMQWRPPEVSDSRFLIVAIDEADIQYQLQQGMKPRGSLADQALEQLLVKLAPHQPAAIGLDVYHDFEFEVGLEPLVRNDSRLIAACEIAQTEIRPYSISGPPGVPSKRLGFTDLPEDPGAVIRRQLLYMDPVAACDTEQSLSLRIASQYLAQSGNPMPELTPEQTLRIGQVEFEPLSPDAGGYQLPADEAGGYQVMLNYRTATFPVVQLRDVLGQGLDAQLPNLIPGRVILIGVVQPDVDAHPTAFGSRRQNYKQPGVIIQAHMISQILSAVEQGRPLIWWWPQWGESLWIGLWAGLGAVLGGWRCSAQIRIGMMALLMGVLFSVCFGGLLLGGWLPLVPTALGMVTAGILIRVWANRRATNNHQLLRQEGADVETSQSIPTP